MAAKQRFSVSGGSIDRANFESGPVALSCAISLATANPGVEVLYVRHPDGSPFGRVERRDSGLIIYREENAR